MGKLVRGTGVAWIHCSGGSLLEPPYSCTKESKLYALLSAKSIRKPKVEIEVSHGLAEFAGETNCRRLCARYVAGVCRLRLVNILASGKRAELSLLR